MNIKRVILETLKDLRPDRVDAMFDYMLNREDQKYIEFDAPDPGVMFIFPDGRMIGDPNTDVYLNDSHERQVDRTAIHHDILDFDIEEDAGDDPTSAQHPVNNEALAKYYNLIVVSAGHSLLQVYVPYGTEPTARQLDQLAEFEDLGYAIEYLEQSSDFYN